MMLSRRRLLATVSAGFAALKTPSLFADGPGAASSAESARYAAFPAQEPEVVREIVGASHGKIDRVRELLASRPALAKATWDWGFGDWETAIGAASHVGNREIAALLIKHGARPDIFTFAMLGHLDVVKAYVEANPGIQRTHGPHGITLFAHAEAGGDKAKPVVEYLKSLGDADIGQSNQPLSDESKALCVGDYSFGTAKDERLIIARSKLGGLSIQRGPSGAPRQLFHKGNNVFHPTGAPAVEIAIEMKGDAVAGLRIVDGGRKLSATRVAT